MKSLASGDDILVSGFGKFNSGRIPAKAEIRPRVKILCCRPGK
ncbi:MAG: hypothetical protein R2860_10615 [Desulfobacterales bacterium]